jgi:hypothetical protein
MSYTNSLTIAVWCIAILKKYTPSVFRGFWVKKNKFWMVETVKNKFCGY